MSNDHDIKTAEGRVALQAMREACGAVSFSTEGEPNADLDYIAAACTALPAALDYIEELQRSAQVKIDDALCSDIERRDKRIAELARDIAAMSQRLLLLYDKGGLTAPTTEAAHELGGLVSQARSYATDDAVEVSRRLYDQRRKEFRECRARVKELEAELLSHTQRRFPVMGGSSVPWSFMVPHEAQAIRNHNQSLERLAKRGGLSPQELWGVCHGRRWRDDHPPDDVVDEWFRGVVARGAE